MKVPRHLGTKGFLGFLILHELNKKSLYGDKLAEFIGERKGSKLTPGTIYPALKYLREKGLIRMKQNGRRKYYLLTKKGKNELIITYRLFGNIFRGLKGKIKE